MKQNKVLHVILFYTLFIASILIATFLLPKFSIKVNGKTGFGLFGLWFIIAGIWGNKAGIVFILSSPLNWTKNYKVWNYINIGLGVVLFLYSLLS